MRPTSRPGSLSPLRLRSVRGRLRPPRPLPNIVPTDPAGRYLQRLLWLFGRG